MRRTPESAAPRAWLGCAAEGSADVRLAVGAISQYEASESKRDLRATRLGPKSPSFKYLVSLRAERGRRSPLGPFCGTAVGLSLAEPKISHALVLLFS